MTEDDGCITHSPETPGEYFTPTNYVYKQSILIGVYTHDYPDTQKEREKEKQSNTTQDLRQLFPKKKLHSGGT